jgi:hypothetical protein
MPRPLPRAVALATILLTLLGITVLALRGIGAPIATGPGAIQTPAASAIPTAASVPPPSAGSPQVFAQIETQVRALRGLPAPSLAPPDILTRAQLEAELRSRFDRDYPPQRRAADNVLLRALGLLRPDQDIGQLQLRLLSAQVIGFYDDKTKRMALVSDSGIGPQVRITYAHEYTHALQDKTFGLGSLQLNAAGEDDRDLARLSLVEGDATTVMLRWALDNMTPQELLEVSQGPVPDMTGIPAWMVDQLQIPYTVGAQFVARLEASGGWPAVDAAFHQPPASTEQVLHYDKYVNRQKPVNVAAPALADGLGSGWREVPADTLGEAMVRIWLQGLGVAEGEATTAAEGWGGDRVVAASGPGAAGAVAWRLAWDTPSDASQFATTYQRVVERLKLAAQLIRVSDRETLVVQGSSTTIVNRAVSALR